MFDEIKQTLRDFRVPFDVYFHENDLYASGATDRALARLRELGNIYDKDGAVWLRTEKFGDDKDRVIVKSDGHGAYISGDAAYYLDKRRARLRPLHHPAGRRPPRLRRPDDGAVRGVR